MFAGLHTNTEENVEIWRIKTNPVAPSSTEPDSKQGFIKIGIAAGANL